MLDEQRVVFLSGRLVNMRPVRKSDAKLFEVWVNDPEVRQFVVGQFAMTYSFEEEWIASLDKKRNTDVVLVIETKDGLPIGTMGIHGIDWVNRIGTTGALIGEKEYWGKGYGTDAKMALLDYAFNTLGLRKICSNVVSLNERSLRYSLHCGYKIEGRRRKHVFKKGKFWDFIELGLFKEEWLPIWNKYKKTGKVR